jgi:hypothetical protein
MPNYICRTCGTQFAQTSETKEVPEQCPLCEDERQYVNSAGQSWTTLKDLRSDRGNIYQQQLLIRFSKPLNRLIMTGFTGLDGTTL